MQNVIARAQSYARRFYGRLAILWRLVIVSPFVMMNLVGYLCHNLLQVKKNIAKAELYLGLVVLSKR